MYIFLDSNILLHFQSFEKLHWDEIYETDSVTLCFAPIVIQEVDQHKYQANGKIRKKAKAVCNKIEKYGLERINVSDKIKVEILVIKPNEQTFNDHFLPMYDQDNELLATILEFKKNKTDEVLLVTNDTGPRLKARSLNISCSKLDEKYLLRPEKNSFEKEILKLQLENEKLKNITPKLKLIFNNRDNIISYTIEQLSSSKETYIDNMLNEIKKKHPIIEYVQEKSPKIDGTTPLTNIAAYINSLSPLAPKQEDYDKYNEQLDKYYTRYRKHLYDLFIYNIQASLKIDLSISLINEGTAPAENTDVNLHFPDGFKVLEKDEWKDLKPNPPSPPSKPKTRNVINSINFPSLNNIYNTPSYSNLKPSNITGISIKKTNSYDVSLNVKYLKHTQNENILDLVILFESFEKIKSFSISYSIVAANIPKEEIGTLNVVLNK